MFFKGPPVSDPNGMLIKIQIPGTQTGLTESDFMDTEPWNMHFQRAPQRLHMQVSTTDFSFSRMFALHDHKEK